jgi:NAD(P)-dependent dehydrogenase (short-subunit alcohol dehydrogenase family)
VNNALVIGSSGIIGQAICQKFLDDGWLVTKAGRSENDIGLSVLQANWAETLAPGSIDAVVWASGANLVDSIVTTDESTLTSMLEANVLYLHRTATALLRSGSLNSPCRFVVISSIWQSIAKANKYSYTITKSALAGLVRSWSIDLAHLNIAVNSVLPGVIDSPMTRRNLSDSEIQKISSETPLGRLVSASEVAAVVAWLSSTTSTGLTGEFIVIDGGWTWSKNV